MKKILGVIILILFCSINLTADLTEGLIAHYPFNGDATDQSGNDIDGIVYGATLTTDRFGNVNSAYEFGGDGDYIEIISSVFEDITETDFSFSVFYKPSAFPLTTPHHNQHFIIGKPGYHTGILFGRSEDGDDINYTGQFFPSDGVSAPIQVYGESNTYPINQWYHLVQVVDDTNKIMKFYINGELVHSRNYTEELYNITTDHIRFGLANNFGQNWDFSASGIIDDAYIYNRAINEEDVQELYYQGGYPTLETGLVAHYPFSGNANDESENGNNGTVIGATLTTDRFGNENSAYDFDGDTDRIEVPLLFSQDQDPVTFVAWVKDERNYPHNSHSPIYGEYISNANRNYLALGYYEGDYRISFSQYPPQSGDAYIDMSEHLNTQEWIFVAFVKQNNECYFWKNDVKSEMIMHTETYSGSSPSIAAIGNRYVNGSWAYNSRTFDGKIDDIRIYNRALSESQIQELYHQGDWPFLAKFSSDSRFGIAPLIVNFFDNSDNSTSWEWDFQNDGIIDSYEQNPIFTYTQSGIYDVRLKATFGAVVDSLINSNYIIVQESQLAPPQNPHITITNSDAVLEWEVVENADYYLIYSSDNPQTDFVFLNYTSNVTSFIHTDIGYQKNKQFYIIIGFDGTMERLTEVIEQNQRKNINVESK